MIEQQTVPRDIANLPDVERYRIGYSEELYDVLGKLGVRRPATVLDAGCGAGVSMQPLVVRGIELTGVDTSSEMLAVAALRVPAATLVSGRVEALPFDDRSFDAAVSAQAFHRFDAETAYSELIRVVKPGGPIAVWWRILGTDEPMYAARKAACALADVEPSVDPLRGGFHAFYRAPFTTRNLRVLPFTARVGIEDWIEYERSRGWVRHGYGAKSDAYIDALRSKLIARYGSLSARAEVRFTQYLYVGSTAS